MNLCFFNVSEESGAATTGGLERAAHLLAKELRRRGHCVEFYASTPTHHRHIPIISSFFPSYSRSEGIRFREFLKGHKIDVAVWHWGSWHTPPFSLKNLPCKLITMWHFIPSWSKQVCADAIIGKFKLHSQPAQRLVRSKLGSSLAWKFYEFYHSRAFFYYALRHSDRFVLLSERFIPEFTLAKKFPKKVCAIPNIASLAVEDVDFATKKKELLWVGRVEFDHKRPDFMLKIWQQLQDSFPDWSLRFVGDGSYLPELKSLATSLNLKNVYFEGYQDPAPYYRSAPIFCMTSAYEGFGLVLIEAQALGCVPVAFESYSAVHDIIEDGVDGVIVPAFDIEKYAEKLSGLMLNPERCERLALNAQKSISKFSEKDIGDKWEKLLVGGGGVENIKNFSGSVA